MTNRGYLFHKRAIRFLFLAANLVSLLWLAFVTFTLHTHNAHERLMGLPRPLALLATTLAGAAVLLGLFRLLGFGRVQAVVNHRWFPLAIFALALLSRVVWLLPLGSVHLTSDFDLYATLAASIADRGSIPAVSQWYVSFAPYVLGYASFLAFLMTLFGKSLLVAQGANIVLASLSAVLIYLIAKKISGRGDTALIASLFWIVMPSMAAIVTLPATESPYIALMLAVLYVILLIPRRRFFWRGFALLAAALLLVVLMNEIRPLGILVIAAGLVYFFITNRFTRQTALPRLLSIGLCVMIFFVVSAQLNLVKDRFLGVPVARNAYGFGLLLGLNYETAGHWDLEDAALTGQAKKAGTPAQEFHQDMIRRAGERFTGLVEQGRLIDLGVKKIGLFWSDTVDFLRWAHGSVDNTPLTEKWFNLSFRASDSLYQVIILLALVESLAAFKQKDFFTQSRAFLVKILLLAIFAMHVIFDINGRYITPAIPLLSILAASGLQASSDYVKGLTSQFSGLKRTRGAERTGRLISR